MKKLLLVLLAILTVCPISYADDTENIALLTKKGFFEQVSSPSFSNSYDDIKKVLTTQIKYSNAYNIEELKKLYSDNYVNSDGLNKEIYFDLVKKTWESYSDIKYKMIIKNIQINGSTAVVDVSEFASATTDAQSGLLKERGLLESVSENVYYLEKINNEWLVSSDHINFEKTFLKYGSAKDLGISLIAPCQIPAGIQYTSTLKMEIPKDSIVIASIGRENITYPQTVAEEVFRKLPEDGILERVFKANDKNINEYAVASFGITKAEFNNGREVKIYVTGLGYVMTRVNVIPKNDFIKVAKNEKTK